jgi:hypothetical protein
MDPEEIVNKLEISYRSIESFYNPDLGWRIATDTAVITCDETRGTIQIKTH